MMTARNRILALVAVALLAAAAAPPAPAQSTRERLDALERKLDSRSLVDMLNRLEQLQRSVQELRGELELQAHRMESMQRQQREQYLDTDRRLQQLEAAVLGGTPGMTPATQSGVQPGMAPATQPGMQPDTAPGAASVPGMQPPAQGTGMPPAGTERPRQSPPGAATPATRQPVAAGAAAEAAKAEYDNALAILRDGRYEAAAQAFSRFLTANPDSEYADNASYWLGETYYVTRDFDQALATFQGLVSRYPQSPKVSDSLLKMGYIHYEKQDWGAAREQLERVVSQYPGTTAARLASDRLERMRREGH